MNASDFPRYHYRAAVSRVIDGDTCAVTVEVGFQIAHTLTIRLAGIDTPERHGPEPVAAELARDALIALTRGRAVYVRTHKDARSFARYVGDLYVENGSGELVNVADVLVERGYAWRVAP